MPHVLIFLIVVGGYSVGNPLERQYTFDSLEACQAAIASMRVEMTQQSNEPDPLAAFCVPASSIAKSPELLACESQLQAANETNAANNIALSECQATRGVLQSNPTECWQADLNGDGIVGAPDQGILNQYGINMQNHFGESCNAL